MKIAHILPMGNMHLSFLRDYNMFLTHLVEKHSYYADFAQLCQGYKILDNSLIELGDAVSLKRVLGAARIIAADEIILPDKFLDCDGTLKRVNDALEEYNRIKYKDESYKLMAVPHGKDEGDWYRCLEELNKIKEIDVIGVPKVTKKLHPDGRKHFVNYMQTDKEIHLLGVWTTFTEFVGMELSKVRGVDTSLTALLAKYGSSISYERKDEEILDLETDTIDDKLLSGYMRGVDQFVRSLS